MKLNVRQEDVLMRHRLMMLVPYLEKENVTDIYINKPCEIIMEYEDGSQEHIEDANLTLSKLEDMGRHLATHYNLEFDQDHPILQCRLPEPYGYRLQFDAFDSVDSGVGISIRLGAALLLPLETFFTEAECEKVRDAINNHVSILVIGETGSGKTTLCNALVQEIPAEERVISIEDPTELTIKHSNSVRLKVPRASGSTTLADRILRHNPKRIIIGEIRSINIDGYLLLLNTGHSIIATLHANSAADTANRLVMLKSESKGGGNVQFSTANIKEQISPVGLIIEIEVKLVKGKLERQKPRLVWVHESEL